jgi:23S rRNA (guanosine2251-2'-O)-methyltransferase
MSKKQNRTSERTSRAPMRPSSGVWLYGWHAVLAALRNPERRVSSLCVTENALTRLKEQGVALPPVTLMKPAEFSRFLPEDAVHQGIAMQVAPLPDLTLEEALEQIADPGRVLLLDQVTDPHNVGAMLRSAAAFGVGAVVLTDSHAPGESAVLAKTACGALEWVKLVRVVNLARALEVLKAKGYWIAGLDGEATQQLRDAKLSGNIALVAGAEGAGLRRLTREGCDFMVKIPLDPRMESLNVSNAVAIALYEVACTP